MKLYSMVESLKQALQTLYLHKFRSALTVLGVIVGTTTVIAVSSIVTGMNARVTKMVERFGTNVAFVSKWKMGPRFGNSSKEEEMRKEITYEDALAIRQLPHVEGVTAMLAKWPGDPDTPVIKYQDRQANQPRFRGVDSNYPNVRDHLVDKGRFFSDEESEHHIQVIVLGYDIANTLFPNLEPIDKEIIVNGQIFRVIGVFEKSISKGLFGGGPNDDAIAMVPLGTFHKMFPQDKDYLISVKSSAGSLNLMVDEVTELLRRRRHISYDKPDDFEVSTAKSSIQSFEKISSILGLIIIPISGMGLLVGGIGVMNIMLVSVTERTKEIGVRRALGARRMDIILQFLIEAISLTSLGGLIGIGLGVFASFIINLTLPSLPSSVPLWSIVVGFSVSVSVGLIFGTWPAIVAAFLDPVEALRYE